MPQLASSFMPGLGIVTQGRAALRGLPNLAGGKSHVQRAAAPAMPRGPGDHASVLQLCLAQHRVGDEFGVQIGE
jgi:hypothetical protein